MHTPEFIYMSEIPDFLLYSNSVLLTTKRSKWNEILENCILALSGMVCEISSM